MLLLAKMMFGVKHGSAVLVVLLSLRSSVAASFGCDNGVMSLQASGWCFWGLPSILESPYVDALTYRFGSLNAAILDAVNAAMSGLARSRCCLAMGCAAARFALDWFVGVHGDAKLDAMLSAATFGHAGSWLCLAMGFATARFALSWFVGDVGAAKLDAMLSAAMGGFARIWFCPVMGFAMARFALDFWIAALIAAYAGDATVTSYCFQSVFFSVIFSVCLVLWFLVPGIEETRILSIC